MPGKRKTKDQKRREKEIALREKAKQKEENTGSPEDKFEEEKLDDYGAEYGEEVDWNGSNDSDGEQDQVEEVYTKAMMNDDLHTIQKTEDMFEIIKLTKRPNATVRLKAAQQMCPCRVKGDIPEFYECLFEMVKDEDAKVRYQVLHNMCDGSPPHYEDRVMACVEILSRDPDLAVRRKASQVIASYTRTGKWNIM